MSWTTKSYLNGILICTSTNYLHEIIIVSCMPYPYWYENIYNTLGRRQNGHHFKMTFSHVVLEWKLLNFNWNLTGRCSQKSIWKINQDSFRYRICAEQASDHYLNHWLLSLLTYLCVTRNRQVNWQGHQDADMMTLEHAWKRFRHCWLFGGIHWSPADFPHKIPVNVWIRRFFVLRPNKLLNKQSSCRWF